MAVMETTKTTQYLTFRLNGEIFALEIAKVREVLDYAPVTRVPRMPASMCGVINLRGGMVPLMDLRRQFGMSPAERTAESCIVITEVLVDGAPTVMGCLADAVQEVVSLETDQIAQPPRVGSKIAAEFIKGMGRREEGFIMILDIDRAIAAYETAGEKAALPA